MVPLAHSSQNPKPHLDRSSRFCIVHENVQRSNTQPDTNTDRPVCSNRPLSLSIAATRLNNSNNEWSKIFVERPHRFLSPPSCDPKKYTLATDDKSYKNIRMMMVCLIFVQYMKHKMWIMQERSKYDLLTDSPKFMQQTTSPLSESDSNVSK